MPLTEESRLLTAFCTPWGVYQWNFLPMGVDVGPQVYQRILAHANCTLFCASNAQKRTGSQQGKRTIFFYS